MLISSLKPKIIWIFITQTFGLPETDHQSIGDRLSVCGCVSVCVVHNDKNISYLDSFSKKHTTFPKFLYSF